MAAEGIFVGLERKQLEKMRDEAVKMLTQGRNIMSWSDGGTSNAKQYAMPPDKMLAEALYALRRLDGRVRGLYTNYNRIVDR
jgi:hypothetical protein